MRFRRCSALLCAAVLWGCAQAGENPPGASGASDLHLQAIVVDGAPPLVEPLTWTVTRLSDESGAPGEVVATVNAAAPTLSLAPGRYIVSAKYGDAERHDEIVVGAGNDRHVLNFRAGFIRLEMIPYAGAPAVDRDITWEIHRYVKGRDLDQSPMVAVATAPSHQFILPEGYYAARARYDGATADMLFPVAAGHRVTYTLNLYAGRVGLSAVSDAGRVEHDVTWRILRATPGENGQREVVTQAVGAAPSMLVREGRYVAQARAGSLAGEAPFEVSAGNTHRVEVTLTAAGD